MNSQPANRKTQQGAVLMLIAFIIGLGAAAFMYKMFNASSLQAAQDEKTIRVLNEAKSALISWSVSHPTHPGIMPFPDRNEDPGKYDNKSDCVDFGLGGEHLIGRLASLSDVNCVAPQNGLGVDLLDGRGEPLWYSVSQNLIRKSDADLLPVINPSIVNTPPYPWMVVRNRNGVIVSDRVAVVILSSGAPLPNQDRSGSDKDADQYLDKIVMADGTPYKNYGYQDAATNPIQEFIIGDDYKNVSKVDPAYKDQSIEPYYYNDKLVYITIDELMYAVEKLVLQETKSTLSDYYQSKGYYPFAAGFGSVANPNQCTKGNLRGLLPVVAPAEHVCSCTSARVCDCNFSVVSNIAFTRTSGNFVATGSASNAPTGACSVAASDRKTCTCTGEGGCKRASGAEQFHCDACGNCTAKVAGINIFGTTGSFSVSTGGCSNTTNQATCSNNTNGTFTLAACDASQVITSLPTVGGQLPAWYLQNEWQKYITYAVSSNCVSGSACSSSTSPPKITVGINNNVGALVATSLANPNGLCGISSYLSEVENTNVIVSNGWQDSAYSSTQPKTYKNTDQVVVVSP